jgi:putative tricarboxylic transport membrane protein
LIDYLHARSIILVAACAAACALALPAFAQTTWKPDKNVELVVGFGPGGTRDAIARHIQRIFQEHKLIPVSSTVVNRPGGGGNLAWAFMAQHANDPHYLQTGGTALLANHITGKFNLTYTDFTPIALLLNEFHTFVVRNDSPLKTGRDLIQKLRENPASVTIAHGAPAGSGTYIATALVMQAAGIDARKLRIAVFNSYAAGMTALLGGHVELAILTPQNGDQQMQAGLVRTIAITSPQRGAGVYAQVPTWRELGVNVVSSNYSDMLAPKGLTAPQIAYWDAVFGKLVQTDEWKKFVAENFVTSGYLDSRETRKFLDGEYRRIKAILTELGLAAR